jgi:hypothetical protein
MSARRAQPEHQEPGRQSSSAYRVIYRIDEDRRAVAISPWADSYRSP